MRTNIDIDDDLMREAMRASGAPTKRAVVEQGLKMLIQTAVRRDQTTSREGEVERGPERQSPREDRHRPVTAW